LVAIDTPEGQKWCGEEESNPLHSLLEGNTSTITFISHLGWNFFSPELRRNAIPHQTHATVLPNIAIEFSIITSIAIDIAPKIEAKISNPNEVAT
jgi:hypothetical protein